MTIAKNQSIYILICLAVFISGLSTGKISEINMVTILHFELFIIALCLLSLKSNLRALDFLKRHFFIVCLAGILLVVVLVYYDFTVARNIYILLILFASLTRNLSSYYERFTNNKLLTLLFVLWLISVSISFYGSPLGVADSYISRVRFEQTIIHFICFFSLVEFSRQSRLTLEKLLLGVSVSTVLLGLCSVYIYFSLDSSEINYLAWKFAPPFSSNIRHLGFQVMVGLIVLLLYVVVLKQNAPDRGDILFQWALFIGMTFLWGFLFWLGGRASIGTTFIVLILTWLILFRKGVNSSGFLKKSLLSASIGIVISEWLAVFPWNGLFKNVDRVVTAIEKLQAPRRFETWTVVWNAVNEHLYFGLGSRAFAFMPIDGGWLRQPHNMFVQFLGEWGIVGGALFLVLLSVAFIRGYKLHITNFDADKSVRALVGGMVIVGLTIHGLVAGTYYYSQPVLNLVIAFAIWVSPIHSSRGVKRKTNEP